MIYNYNGTNFNTNLGGNSFRKLSNGSWKLCLITDNVGIEDENTSYYQTVEIDIYGKKVSKRCFTNKNFVNLVDGTRDHLHIIHWCPSNGYFCVTTDPFWDQFDS